MSCPGFLFSIDQPTLHALTSLPDAAARAAYVRQVLAADYPARHPQWTAGLGESWNALHRSLTDGELAWDNGEYPLSHVVFGGEVLCATSECLIVLKTSAQVADVAQAVSRVFRSRLREQYFLLDAEDYGRPLSELDFAQAWQQFDASKAFWQQAAAEQRSVLFTVDQ